MDVLILCIYIYIYANIDKNISCTRFSQDTHIYIYYYIVKSTQPKFTQGVESLVVLKHETGAWDAKAMRNNVSEPTPKRVIEKWSRSDQELLKWVPHNWRTAWSHSSRSFIHICSREHQNSIRNLINKSLFAAWYPICSEVLIFPNLLSHFFIIIPHYLGKL